MRHDTAIPLCAWVHQRLERRLAYAGYHIGDLFSHPRYRRRLVPFIESVMVGCHGHAVELARHFAVTLDAMRHGFPPQVTRDRLSILDQPASFWNRPLATLFTWKPEWETQLRAWADEVSSDELPADEPAWKRIRRLRDRAARQAHTTHRLTSSLSSRALRQTPSKIPSRPPNIIRSGHFIHRGAAKRHDFLRVNS